MAGLEPGDWEKITQWVENLLGRQLPAFVTIPLGVLVFVALLLSIVLVITLAAAKIGEAWSNHLRPKAYSPEQKQRAIARRQFGQYLGEEIRKRNRTENWRDQEYAELEAEVEAEGRRRGLIPFLARRRGLRRERSLAIALRLSEERLILVEGEPGSGKSVALRHLALQLTEKAGRSASLAIKLPVYINLKELKRPHGSAIDRDLIRGHVLHSLNRVNDHFVDEFLEQEFDNGIRQGLWIFLFDSFDELPDVLSAIEADETTKAYSEAISNFLSGINACRGIVASRYYRGPKTGGWSTFRILPLTASRQTELVRKAVVANPGLALQIESGVAVASEDIRVMAQNPMLLGLLCEHVRLGFAFPTSSYEVMSKYVGYRLSRDSERVALRYQLDESAVMRVAESAAFAMTADASLGLSPTMGALERSLLALELGFKSDEIRRGLEALVYMRLARLDSSGARDEQEFTFSHRRFQEYFVTKMLLSGAREISPFVLLTDARWRETAVVLLQLAEPSRLQPLLRQIEQILTDAASGIEPITVPIGIEPEGEVTDENLPETPQWSWPEHTLHVLSILQAGTNQNAALATPDITSQVAIIVQSAFFSGDLLDAKLALQVAGPAPEETLVDMMRRALRAESRWLDDVVYWQAARLSRPDPEISRVIRRSILQSALGGALRKSYIATQAYLARLPDREKLLQVLRLGYWAPWIDFSAFAFLAIVAAASSGDMVQAGAGLSLYAVYALLERLSFRFGFLGFVGLYARLAAGMVLALSILLGLSDTGATTPVPPDGMDPHFGNLSMIEWLAVGVPVAWWALWRPSAKLGISSGAFVHPLAWPLLPLAAVYVGATMLREIGRKFREILSHRKAVLALLLMAPITALVVGGTIYVVSVYPTPAKIIFLAFAVLSAFIFGISFGSFALAALADYRLARSSGDMSKSSVVEFDQKWRLVRTRIGRVNLLRRRLRGDLTDTAADWVAFAKGVIAEDPALRAMAKIRTGRTSTFAALSLTNLGTEPRAGLVLRNFFLLMHDQSYLGQERDLLFTLLDRARQM